MDSTHLSKVPSVTLNIRTLFQSLDPFRGRSMQVVCACAYSYKSSVNVWPHTSRMSVWTFNVLMQLHLPMLWCTTHLTHHPETDQHEFHLTVHSLLRGIDKSLGRLVQMVK